VLVVMKSRIGGTRNGEEWPAVGGVVDVPDHEAADLITAGYAAPAKEDHDREAGPDDGSAETGAAGPEATGEGPEAPADTLDELDRDALIAYADEHDIKVNKRHGADKLRAAIREV
jgi:hypothetical protein